MEGSAMHWLDKTKLGGKGGLGRVEYYHVHDDGTEHKATIIPKELSGKWFSIPGVYCQQIVVGCDDCGIIMQEDDIIKVVVEKQ